MAKILSNFSNKTDEVPDNNPFKLYLVEYKSKGTPKNSFLNVEGK